jgi:hypothetical protein
MEQPARRRPRTAVAGLVLAGLLVAGCGGEPEPLATIGSPTPTPTQVALAADRPAQLARRFDLTGVPLPADWPDVPVPAGTEVVTAYGIGAEPRRTWTATFLADRGSALDLAEPVVAVLRERGYVPIAEYVGAASTNTGLYSFAAPSFAVYVVLGEDDGRPNLVLTIRGAAALPGQDGAGVVPMPSPSPSTSPGASSAASEDAGSPAPSANP